MNLPSGGYTIDDLATDAEPSGDIVITVQNIENYAFMHKNSITGVFSDTALTVGDSFQYCDNLKTISFPNATKIGSQRNNKSLISANFPKVNDISNYCFYECTSLVSVNAPLATKVGIEAFRQCAFQHLDLPKCININRAAFRFCASFNLLILRSEKACGLAHWNDVFERTPFADGGTGGTIYVPAELIPTYEAHWAWSVIIGYENNQILPIEGSIYETQYADGTPIT